MEIIVNNQSRKLPEDRITVQQLLQQEIPGKQSGIAVAINNQIVSKSNWEQTCIADKDNILIIRATQGG